MTEPDWKARAEAAEREVALLRGELVSSKSREWPDGFKALEKERDAWKRCSEDLVNQRDAAREALGAVLDVTVDWGIVKHQLPVDVAEKVRRALEGA